MKIKEMFIDNLKEFGFSKGTKYLSLGNTQIDFRTREIYIHTPPTRYGGLVRIPLEINVLIKMGYIE